MTEGWRRALVTGLTLAALAGSAHGARGQDAPPPEAFTVLVRRGELVAQDLERDQPVQCDVARQKDDAHPAAAQLAHDLKLRSQMLYDLLALPVRRHQRHRANGGQLQGIRVTIDKDRQRAHDTLPKNQDSNDLLKPSDTSFPERVCRPLRKDRACPGHYGSNWPEVTCAEIPDSCDALDCPLLGRGEQFVCVCSPIPYTEGTRDVHRPSPIAHRPSPINE